MKHAFLLLILLIPIRLFSATWHVNQDGTGDFTTIQNAVTAAGNNDTIIINEGIYYEYIVTGNKPLTVASLYHLDGDTSHIGNTIIDGENSHPLFRSVLNSFGGVVNIIGLTFRNGFSEASDTGDLSSGGIGVRNANLTISHCSIYNNWGSSGGGLSTKFCNVSLIANSIRDNIATQQGGGMFLFMYTYINGLIQIYDATLDPVEMNSFYNNRCAYGSDLHIIGAQDGMQSIIADTLSVGDLDQFYNVVLSQYAIPLSNVTIQANEVTLPRVSANLFVAPWGDDSNDGLTPESPLQTIFWASSIIESSESNPRTIHLLPGEYTWSGNQNFFPIYIRDYTYFMGDSPETTIIDCENIRSFSVNKTLPINTKLENFSVNNYQWNGNWLFKYGILIEHPVEDVNTDLEFRNLHFNQFSNNSTCDHSYIALMRSNTIIENCQFGSPDNTAINFQSSLFEGAIGWDVSATLSIKDCKFYNQFNPLYIQSVSRSTVNITNCLFDSRNTPPYSSNGHIKFDIYMDVGVDGNIINNTFYGNRDSGQLWGSIYTSSADYSHINIQNNIMVDSFPQTGNRSIMIDGTYGPYPLDVYVGNNLIVGGESTTYHPNWPELTFTYEDTNIDTIPHFTGYGINRFMLDSDSPCIDAGTLNLPANFVLPEHDLAVNPRVYGDTIDMGCYEWQGNVADFEMQYRNNSFPLEVLFVPSYNFPINSIAWDFNLDGTIDSYELNPEWTFANDGTHNVAMYINEGEAIEIKLDCIDQAADTSEEEAAPLTDELLACYPNPIRISSGYVVFKYNVEHVGKAELKVYNIKGQLVRSITTPSQVKGKNTIFWHATDSRGVHVSSGMYLYKLLQNGKEIGKGKITVIKN